MAEGKASAADFMKRWWWAFALAGIGILIGLLAWASASGKADRKNAGAVAAAKAGLEQTRDKLTEDLADHVAAMDDRREELDEIKAIDDGAERRRKLAEFANRRR